MPGLEQTKSCEEWSGPFLGCRVNEGFSQGLSGQWSHGVLHLGLSCLPCPLGHLDSLEVEKYTMFVSFHPPECDISLPVNDLCL